MNVLFPSVEQGAAVGLILRDSLAVDKRGVGRIIVYEWEYLWVGRTGFLRVAGWHWGEWCSAG